MDSSAKGRTAHAAMDRRRFLGLAGSLALLPASLSLASIAPRPNGYRLAQDGAGTRLILDLPAHARYQVFTLASPPRVVIDLDGVQTCPPVQPAELARTPVAAIRSGHHDGGLRLVLDLRTAVQPRASLLDSAPGQRQLVVELGGGAGAAAQGLAQEAPQPHPRKGHEFQPRPLVIAIDAGHGGKDPGAISANDHYEKYVAMSVADKLQGLLAGSSRYRPALTRDDDHFIPLHERVLIAHRHKADMFISIHADAAPSTSARGASVYALSEHGATSAMARWMADSENSADQYASLRDSSLYTKDPELSKVLVDMSMSATINASLDLGNTMIDNLGQVTRIHQRRVDQAGFAVLKSPDIPSILVETGFMSNRDDCSRLITERHQQELAEALHESIENYFRRNPLPYMIS